MRLLVVEDDETIAEPLLAGLAHHGLTAEWVTTGEEAVRAVLGRDVDLVLLDLGLPDVDGTDVCRRIRQTSNVPIIMVTARGEEIDRVVGLEIGADDYIVKPFGVRELVARVRAVLRRTDPVVPGRPSPATNAPITADAPVAVMGSVGSLKVDERTRRVSVGGQEIALTTKEFGVLSLLAEDPGAVVTRATLLERVWDEHWYGPTKTLDVHVAQLRRKLGDPAWIETVRGVGFRLVDPAARSENT